MSRKPISKRTRFEVFKRDGFKCGYCGATPPGAFLEVDHINPVALGGDNDPNNLITACQDCNRGKAAVPLSAVPTSLAERAAEIEEREAQIAGYAEVAEAARERVEEDAWRVAEHLSPGATKGYPRDRLNGIRKFVKELGVHNVLDAADMSLIRYRSETQTFKYFCGICWNWIRDGRQDG
jgi:hypothetical protein